jgi:hypothetical protein
MALSGGGTGARKQEGQITDRKFGGQGLASDHRIVRAALMRLTAGQRDTLAAAYGEQRRWHPDVRRALTKALPDHYANAYGAALLVERVQQGLANPRERADDIDDSVLEGGAALSKEAKRKAKQRAVTGIVVWCPPSKAFRRGDANESELEAVARETRERLDDAHQGFADAIGQHSRKREPSKTAAKPKRKRERVDVDRVYPFDVGG